MSKFPDIPEYDEFVKEHKRIVICPPEYAVGIRQLVPYFYEVVTSDYCQGKIFVVKPPDLLEAYQSVLSEQHVQFHIPYPHIDVQDPAATLRGINGVQ